MREILFRGKRLYICDWVEGTGIFNDGTNTWISFNEPSKPIDFGMKHQTVYTETVGQFTGLTDKNGKKIFEGDIVKAKASHPCGGDVIATVVVSLDDYELMWDLDHSHEIEVIGNIHDNPELLGGENDGKGKTAD